MMTKTYLITKQLARQRDLLGVDLFYLPPIWIRLAQPWCPLDFNDGLYPWYTLILELSRAYYETHHPKS